MLWAVPAQVLARLEFPLGGLTKDEVRAAAAAAGLEVADEPESQEVCFAVDGYQDFLEGRGVEPAEGDLVDAGGAVVGRHQGHWRYTVGQRRGIGVAPPSRSTSWSGGPPRTRSSSAAATQLDVRSVRVRDVVDRALGDGDGLEVQLRYRSAAVAGRRARAPRRRAAR